MMMSTMHRERRAMTMKTWKLQPKKSDCWYGALIVAVVRVTPIEWFCARSQRISGWKRVSAKVAATVALISRQPKLEVHNVAMPMLQTKPCPEAYDRNDTSVPLRSCAPPDLRPRKPQKNLGFPTDGACHSHMC